MIVYFDSDVLLNIVVFTFKYYAGIFFAYIVSRISLAVDRNISETLTLSLAEV